jgi:DNA invertase Pin-like site-specific DNA recombinase
MRAACYVRVSRPDQDPALQLDETAAFVARRGWRVARTYRDLGVSGSRERRPELDELLEDARRGAFDVLVVWRADRLFRSMRHMVLTLDELASLGIDFVSVTEPFDTTTPQGRLLFHVAGVFAEFERGLLIERTKAGLAAARRRGKRLGRPRVFVPVLRARAMIAEGASLRRVARSLGVGFGTLHRALAAADPETSADEAPEDAADAGVRGAADP